MSLPVILAYHSIDDRSESLDTWQLSVSPKHFAEQIEALSADRRIISLVDLARHLRAGQVPLRTVVVTFDDGYSNVITTAKPVLERFDAPATLFLATGWIDAKEYWWEKLQRIVANAEFMPREFTLNAGDRTLSVQLEHQEYEATVRAIWRKIRSLDLETRESALAELECISNVPPLQDGLRPATTEELLQLSDGPISLGCHTVTHPSMRQIDLRQKAYEVAASKAKCECLLGKQVFEFAYPYGEHDFESRTVVEASGCIAACTTEAAPVRQGCDPFALPRFGVGNWDGDVLIEKIRKISDVLVSSHGKAAGEGQHSTRLASQSHNRPL